MQILGNIIQALPVEHVYGGGGWTEQFVKHVCADSRQVVPGTLFVAIQGGQSDGHRYIPSAVAQGAVAIVGTIPPAELAAQGIALPPSLPYIQVENSRMALALAAAALYNFPSRALTVIGVTGTDGKTTTCSLLEALLVAATSGPSAPQGLVGVVTTVGARIRGSESDTGFHVTTPDAPDVQRFLAEMVNAGCRYGVVESTSHGLDQARVAAVDFDLAVVTNITHEHLDYHKSREAYVAAKARLFRALYTSSPKAGVPRCAVLNGDDEGSIDALLQALAEEASAHGYEAPVRIYGMASGGKAGERRALDVTAVEVRYEPEATRFQLQWWGGSFPVESPLIGEFNVYNTLAAATAALVLGIEPHAIQQGIANMTGVLGRMERIDRGQDFLALVDFAHSPASLERALKTLRPLVGKGQPQGSGRLIAIFGSAGLRDVAKRGLMGEISGKLADFTVVTAEDPRTEDLGEINRAIAAGVERFASPGAYVIVDDRAEAIQYAVDMAEAGDVVAAFGKGHERSMCYGITEYPWSDQDAMGDALERRLGRVSKLTQS
jgi:UDP-N-acetylmuramoyl-L-alanyl-D-glutamate--2,6-diaminopimelate ligase